MNDRPSEAAARPPASRRGRWIQFLALAAGLPLAIVAWEYLLNALLNPEVDWNLTGVGAHMALDLAVAIPLVALILAFGLPLARRLGLRREGLAGVLGTAGLLALLFATVMLPWNSLRDLAHDWMGTTYGISLAEVQTTVVRSDLTVREATQLCSLGSVRNPSLARNGYQDIGVTLWARFSAGFNDTLLQLAAFLPLLLLVLMAANRRRFAGASWAPARAVVSWTLRPARLAAVGATGLIALFCFGGLPGESGSLGVADAQTGVAFNACTDGGAVKEYDISAINLTITLNRWGDHVNGAYMYALDANLPALRQFEADLETDRAKPDSLEVARVAYGLRKDLIQPLVLRANLGECLRVNLTNQLARNERVSIHLLGLPHTAANAGGAVGNNPDTFAGPGQTVTYEIPIPRDPNAERAYYFHSHGAGRQQQNMGLFGAIVAEPAGATYLDVETGEPLDTVTGSNWEAIIVDPNAGNLPDGKNFREFVLFYHEIGDEGFTDIRDSGNKKLPLVDEVAGVYRPAARALNYRSEPFRRRMEFDKEVNNDVTKHGKSQGYGSYMFGDPATPMPRSYVGEGVKTRLVHGGSEVFHVHHLHGGGDRWRRNPNADPNNDFWKGLTKIPDSDLASIHLDSQSIGPGTSYNLEHECGAGGCQQGVGDFLFHCHIGHHYIAGMWSFWRVYGTEQTAETNLAGYPLAVVPDLFQNPSNPLIAPSPPAAGVSAFALLGSTVDDGRVLVADADVTDPNSQMGLMAWIEHQLPPRGERLDNGDATVWNWVTTGEGASLRVWGEPESDVKFPGYVSAAPGTRPEVTFNPKNARYTYPLFRPQAGARPPFTARHSGAPYLGEEMKEGRVDGLCARNGIAPSVDVGNAVDRFYPTSAITLPIQVTADRADPNGMIFVLNEEEAAIRAGSEEAQPLTIRSNVGDCVELILTNKIPDGALNKNFSKVNMHTHFVQFDTQASDGVITGFSYEQSMRPIESEGRTLTGAASAGDMVINVNHTDRLREGIWLGVGLGEGSCGTTADGQPKPCTEVRQITGLTSSSITLDRPLSNDHSASEAVGVEFVRYKWYSDVDFGTVFFHQHVEFKDWDHGLFGTHIVEPKGSTYHDPTTGEEVRTGALADIHVDPSAGGNPVAHNVEGSFREFVLYLHNNSPVERPFTLGGGTINLRAEPWRLRTGDPAHRFSSVTHDDPHTPMPRAYVGDPVVIRGVGLVERVGGIRFTGHRFQSERYRADSDTRDAQFIGISERFSWSLDGGAGGPAGFPGDYLYYSTLGRDFESGAWGLLRVHDTQQSSLQPLPGIGAPPAGAGFPQLTHTGEAPPASEGGEGQVCPAGAPVREYSIVARNQDIIYTDRGRRDTIGVAYHLKGQPSRTTRLPLVLRANAGDCLRVGLRNLRSFQRSSLSIGELLFDPQRSYGAAIGYNQDSTVPAGSGRVYEYYADRELGIVIGLNLADIQSVERGAFAGVVIEPEGSVYRRPGSTEPLPGGGTGIQADIVTDGVVTREFVALISDQDRRIGQNTMPYPANVENFNGISYGAEPLRLRNMVANRADVFKSSIWGDPRQVVTVPAGTPLVYRVSQPWGNQTHLPTLEGHRWLLEPDMAGSEQVFNDVLVPGTSTDMYFVGGAGGDIEAPGDYLFLDRRQPFMEGGMWNLLRVTDDGKSGGGDRVKLVEMAANPSKSGRGSKLSIDGLNTPRPAGDTASWVDLYAGSATGGRCNGSYLGRAAVDIGSGVWRFEQEMASVPTEVCVVSEGGGVTSRQVGP